MIPFGDAPSRSLPPSPAAEPVIDQLSGDLLCPLCGEPLEVRIERTEYGAEPVGHCASCMSLVEIQ